MIRRTYITESKLYYTNTLAKKWEGYPLFSDCLKNAGSTIHLIQSTKDIWCRDFMPVRVQENKLVQFRYEPSYLKDDAHLRSIPIEVNAANKIDAIYSDINLDGGNVVFGEKRVIISDRIFSENLDKRESSLIQELEQLLEAEVLIFPSIRSEMTGHADGMVRFYNANTILLSDPSIEYAYWQNAVKRFVEKYQLNVITFPAFIYRSKQVKSYNAIGCYINYLETNNLILVPQYACEGNRDAETLALFKHLYPDRMVEGINCFELAKEGGVLNCVTWN